MALRRWLKRLGLGVLGLVALLLALLVGSVLLDGWLSRDQVATLTNVTIPNSNGPAVRAYVARPPTPGPAPVVIMIHEFWGLRPALTAKADFLATQGYLVIAPDLFRGSAASWVPRAIYQVVSTPAEQTRVDLDAVFAWATQQPDGLPDRVAIMGFCFGGGTALRYSVTNDQLAATVVFYGSPITDTAQLQHLPGPVLGIFGGADNSIPVEEVEAFEAALTEVNVLHQISIYPNQPHAFVTDVAAIQADPVQGQAWAEFLAFLAANLKDAPSQGATPAPVAASPALGWDYVWRLAWAHWVGPQAHGH